MRTSDDSGGGKGKENKPPQGSPLAPATKEERVGVAGKQPPPPKLGRERRVTRPMRLNERHKEDYRAIFGANSKKMKELHGMGGCRNLTPKVLEGMGEVQRTDHCLLEKSWH